MDIAQIGFRADTADLARGEHDMDSFAATGERTENRVVRSQANLQRSFATTTKAIRATSSASRGFNVRGPIQQLSQVAQQASVTGDVMGALAVQAFDIGLAFGTLGTVLGVAAGLVLPLADDFLGLGNEADKASDKVEDFTSALSEAQRLAEIAATPISDLRKEFGDFAEEVQRASQIAAQAALAEAMREYDAVSESLRDSLLEVRNSMLDAAQAQEVFERVPSGATEQALERARKVAAFLAKEIGLTTLEAGRLDLALQQLGSANGMAEVATSASSALDLIKDMFEATENIPPEVSAIVAQLVAVQRAAASGVAAFDDMTDAALNTATAAAGIVRALSLANRIGSQVNSGGRGSDPRLFQEGGRLSAATYQSDVNYNSIDTIIADFNNRNLRRSGGGGGGGANREHNQRLREAERVIRSLESATEAYNRELADLQELQELGYLSTEQLKAAQEQLAQTFADDHFADVLGGFDDIADSIASAIVSTQSLGDAFRVVLQQMIADLLRSNIRNMLMDTFNIGGTRTGGGFLGSIFGGIFGGGRADGGPVRAGRLYEVGEEGPELFAPGQSGTIIPNHAIGGTAKVELVGGPLMLTDNGTIMAEVNLRQAQSAAVISRREQSMFPARQTEFAERGTQ